MTNVLTVENLEKVGYSRALNQGCNSCIFYVRYRCPDDCFATAFYDPDEIGMEPYKKLLAIDNLHR